MMLCTTYRRWLLVVWLVVWAAWPGAPPALAQAPAEPAQAPAAGEAGALGEAAAALGDAAVAVIQPERIFGRFSFLNLDQASYTIHPFATMTRDGRYTQAGTGGSSEVGTTDNEQSSNFLEQLVHALPPFGLEVGWTRDLYIIRGVSLGFDFVRIHQNERDASGATSLASADPQISADSYYYNGVMRAYIFDPTEPGLNYFVGVGLGVLEGQMTTKNNAAAGEEKITFRQVPIGTTRLGLETKGDNFGFRYEIMLVIAEEVKLDRNPFPGQTDVTTLDYSGAIIRLSLYYHFDVN